MKEHCAAIIFAVISFRKYGPSPSDIRYDTFDLLMANLSEMVPGNIALNSPAIHSHDV